MAVAVVVLHPAPVAVGGAERCVVHALHLLQVPHLLRHLSLLASAQRRLEAERSPPLLVLLHREPDRPAQRRAAREHQRRNDEYRPEDPAAGNFEDLKKEGAAGSEEDNPGQKLQHRLIRYGHVTGAREINSEHHSRDDGHYGCPRSRREDARQAESDEAPEKHAGSEPYHKLWHHVDRRIHAAHGCARVEFHDISRTRAWLEVLCNGGDDFLVGTGSVQL